MSCSEASLPTTHMQYRVPTLLLTMHTYRWVKSIVADMSLDQHVIITIVLGATHNTQIKTEHLQRVVKW